MPPHSIGEWIIGQNITPRTFARSSKRDVVKVAVSTDDEAESNTLSVTYPRTRKTAKKVRFHVTSPRRSALKNWTSNSSSETLVGGNTSSSDADEFSTVNVVDYDTEGSYQGDTSDSSTQVIKRRTTKVKRKHHLRTIESGSSTDDETDDEPHPTCPCPKCITGRRRLKIAKKSQKTADTSEDDESEGSEDTNAKMKGKSKKQQSKDQRAKVQKDEATSTEASEATQTDGKSDDETTDEPAVVKSKKQKNNGNEKKGAAQGKGKAQETNSKGKDTENNNSNAKAKKSASSMASNTADKSNKSKASKKSAKLPEPSDPPSDIRTPHLLMPVTAKVLQVEHTVETPDDPRPNAFVDHEHGIVRVYHGPAYGNPYGTLYPRRKWSGQVPPAGVPHPLNNPYFNGFKQPMDQNSLHVPPDSNWPPPSGGFPSSTAFPWSSGPNPQTSFPPPAGMHSYGSNAFPPPVPQVAGMTDEEAAAAAAQGIGLTGLPPHPMCIPNNPFPWEREGRKDPAPWSSVKDKISDAANNVGPDSASIGQSKTFGGRKLQTGSAHGGSQKSNQSKKSNNGSKSQKDGMSGWPPSSGNDKPWLNGGGDHSWPRDDNNANQDGNDNWGAIGDNNFGGGEKTGGGGWGAGWGAGWGGNGSHHGGSVAGGGGWGGNQDDNGGGNTWGGGSNNGFKNDSGGWSGNTGGDNQGWGGGSNHGSNNGAWNSGGGNGGWNRHGSPVGQGSHRGSDSGKTPWNNGQSSSMPGAWNGSQNGGDSRQASGGWNGSPNNVGGWGSGGSHQHTGNSPNMGSNWKNSDKQDGRGSHHGSNFGGNGGWGSGGSPQNNSGWGFGNDNNNNNDQNKDQSRPAWEDHTVAQSTQGPGINW